MLTSAHRLSRNAVIDPTHSALEPSPAGLEAESRFFRHYESEDLVLFRLERMRQDFMNAKRCVGWPERFRATLDPSRKEYTRHANLFVLLSGMADTKGHSEIVHALQGSALSNSGTPLLQTWKMPVMAENSGTDFFSRSRKHMLGFMPDQRATTFREGCGIRASEKEYGQFYNRPYGASLCPAWASGPVFLLPRILPGLRPLEDGWETFACQPSPDIRDIRCAVPAPHGLSEAEWVDGKLSLHYPLKACSIL